MPGPAERLPVAPRIPCDLGSPSVAGRQPGRWQGGTATPPAVRALRSPARYIALIASRKRSRLVLDFLREQGFGEEDLARIRAPAGLDLGARTPEEMALSVLGEIVLVRRGGSGRPMCEAAGLRARARRDGADMPEMDVAKVR